jgi:hypothetical protein
MGQLGDREHVDQIEEQLDVGYPGGASGVADQIERCPPPGHAAGGRRWPDSTPRTDRNDITDPADRADSSDRADNDEPMLNADAKEPTDPIDRKEPTDPIDRTDPRDPIDRREPWEHSDHFDEEFMAAIVPTRGSSGHPWAAARRSGRPSIRLRYRPTALSTRASTAEPRAAG